MCAWGGEGGHVHGHQMAAKPKEGRCVWLIQLHDDNHACIHATELKKN